MNYNRFSNYFGLFASHEFARPIQRFLNSIYVWIFRINMSDFEVPSDGFKSLNALFTRILRQERELNGDFISPSDGEILSFGSGSDFTALSVKNHDYSVRELLANSLKNELNGEFDYANIYLSPRDYHHFHAPCDLCIESCEYVRGELFSVAKSWLKRIPNLYAKNERVILKTRIKGNKLLWIVFVGALNVGKIRLDFEPRIQTNAKNGNALYKYENLNLKKGEHIGNFELGSTIVLICEKDLLEFTCKNGKINFGEQLARLI